MHKNTTELWLALKVNSKMVWFGAYLSGDTEHSVTSMKPNQPWRNRNMLIWLIILSWRYIVEIIQQFPRTQIHFDLVNEAKVLKTSPKDTFCKRFCQMTVLVAVWKPKRLYYSRWGMLVSCILLSFVLSKKYISRNVLASSIENMVRIC